MEPEILECLMVIKDRVEILIVSFWAFVVVWFMFRP